MTMIDKQSAAACDAETYALEAAEAAFILEAQVEIQKLLHGRGLRARDLSKRLGVTEARISQMLGDAAKNLTLKTIARIFYQLGEKPHLTTEAEFLRCTSGVASAGNQAEHWTVLNLPRDLEVAAASEETAGVRTLDTSLGCGRTVNRWARAEEAVSERPRRTASGR